MKSVLHSFYQTLTWQAHPWCIYEVSFRMSGNENEWVSMKRSNFLNFDKKSTSASQQKQSGGKDSPEQ
jgi:hypothetical protein